MFTRPLLVLLLLAFPLSTIAQSDELDAFVGDWVFRINSDPTPQRVALLVKEDSVRGRVYGTPFSGVLDTGMLTFDVGGYTWAGTLSENRLTGQLIDPDGDTFAWSADRYQPPAAPRTFVHEPTNYHRLLSSRAEPALRIFPGDTVRTTTVDAAGWSTGGYRERGNRVTEGGNPLTGPFYIEGTLPGDVLAVSLQRVRLNRNWAYSGDAVMSNVLDASYIRDREVEGNLVQWTLEDGFARLTEPTTALADYKVALTPFLGSIAVVPGDGVTPSSRDSGPYGGNMEYAEIREGATVYLPVSEEGAYLYLGDGHAVQGDGELTGDALETSMELVFTVDVQRYRFRSVPRVVTPESIASVGIAGSLDLAIQEATSDMARWLESDYGLSSTETALVLGTAVEYDIPDVVRPWVSVAIKISKSVLAQINQ